MQRQRHQQHRGEARPGRGLLHGLAHRRDRGQRDSGSASRTAARMAGTTAERVRATRAHHQVHPAEVPLRVRHVEVRAHGGPLAVAHVAHDADDRLPRLLAVGRAGLQPLADGALAGPETARHRRRHDGDRAGVGPVGVVEDASVDQRDLHRREVVRADRLVVGVGVARLRLGRLAFDGEGIVPANRVGQRAQQHQCRRIHAGQRREAVEQRTVERGARLVIGIAVAELNLGGDDAAGSKPGSRRASVANDCAARAAPATRPRESASWPATSTPRARPTRRLPATRRLDSRTTSPASTREARQAGAVPKSTAAPSDSASATPSTRQSMARRSIPGTSRGNEAADDADRPCSRPERRRRRQADPAPGFPRTACAASRRARRPHRRPHGELALAIHATRQQQIGDVRARNQQQAGDGCRPAGAARVGSGRRSDRQAARRWAPRPPRAGCSRASAAVTTSRLARAASSVTPVFIRPMSFEHAKVRRALGQACRRDPDVDVARQHPRRHHADDRGRAAADADVATHQCLVGAVLTTPQAVADEHARAGRVGALAVAEVAPSLRRDAERAEVARRDQARPRPARHRHGQ